MAKYNFSIQIGNKKFGIDGCDSFDEALARVQKGVYEYKLAHPEDFRGTDDWTPAERLQRMGYQEAQEARKELSVPFVPTPTVPTIPPSGPLPNSTGGSNTPVL